MYSEVIDFSKMVHVKMPVSNHNPGFVMRVTEESELRLNRLLLKELQEKHPDRRVYFLRSDDFRVIAFPEGEYNRDFKFCTNGAIKHLDFFAGIRARDFKIPARYNFEWREDLNAWIGILDEIPEISSMENVIRKASVKSKSVNAKKKNV